MAVLKLPEERETDIPGPRDFCRRTTAEPARLLEGSMNSTLTVEVAGEEVQTEALVIGDLLSVESDLPLV